MTYSCRICSKLLCPNRGMVENCKECVSYVLLAMREINKKIKMEEQRDYDRFFKDSGNR